jgi:hypothetical protein
MSDAKIPGYDMKQVLEVLKATELPPIQAECLEHALRAGTDEDTQALLALVSEQVVREQRFAKAILEWFATTETTSERIGSALEEAARHIEDEMLAELLLEQ